MVTSASDIEWAAAHPQASLLHQQITSALPDEDSLHVELIMWLSRLGRLIDLVGSQLRADTSDLDASEHAVLACLLFNGEPYQLSPTTLSERVVQTTGGMAKTLRRLQEKGLVKRVRDEGDGRALHVVLTGKGLKLARTSIVAVARSWSASLDSYVDVDPALVTTVVQLVSALENVSGLAR